MLSGTTGKIVDAMIESISVLLASFCVQYFREVIRSIF